MATNQRNPHAYATPELRAAALALVRATMEEKRLNSNTIAAALGIPAEVLKLAIEEDGRDIAAQSQAHTAQIMALTQAGRTSQQVARTMKLTKWEVECHIKDAQAREREALRTAEQESPELFRRTLALMEAGRTAAQVARTLKAPKTRINAIALRGKIDAAEPAPLAPVVFAPIHISEHLAQTVEYRQVLAPLLCHATIEKAIRRAHQKAASCHVEHVDVAPHSQSSTCPKCGGTDWKLLQHVFNEGLQSLHAASTSTGVGINLGGAIGVGRATTTTVGIQQNELSRRASPPSAPPSGWHYLGCAVCFSAMAILLLYGGYSTSENWAMWLGGGCLLFSALAWGAWLQAPAEQERYTRQLNVWHRTRMCTRCGHFYL
jgi:ribosomal protein S27AE